MENIEQFVTDNRESLTLFINRYVRDITVAEEIAIDAFAEFFCSRRWNGTASRRTYLFTIGRSRAIDHLRREKRRAARTAPLEEGYTAEVSEDEIFAQVFRDERRRILEGAVAKLAPDMAAVVHLIYFEEMSYADAAAALRINRKRVDNLLYRAKAELKEILGEEGRELL